MRAAVLVVWGWIGRRQGRWDDGFVVEGEVLRAEVEDGECYVAGVVVFRGG